MCVCALSGSVVSNSFQSYWPQLSRLLWPWDFPVKSTAVGCHFLLQGIFPTRGLNLWLLRWQAGRFCAASQCKWGDFVQFAFPAKPEWPGHLDYWFMWQSGSISTNGSECCLPVPDTRILHIGFTHSKSEAREPRKDPNYIITLDTKGKCKIVTPWITS